jgi:hypothetical protein
VSVLELSPSHEVQIHVEDSHEAIDLIDSLRAHGLDAELADTPGSWDVVTDGPLEEAAEIAEEELSRHECLH